MEIIKITAIGLSVLFVMIGIPITAGILFGPTVLFNVIIGTITLIAGYAVGCMIIEYTHQGR